VYSASEVAREEFPNEDITVRGAVSIGRRLMDPLAELVKIDPKSIGVGQYQHDVNPFRLKEKLDQTVVSCVNAVGVNINTASKKLLNYV
ncbi:RNA-binding transcriptional accessory protein, partial [Acinetobacter baumannii]